MHILFPSNPLSNNPTDSVDEQFKEEVNVVKVLNHNYGTFDFDLFEKTGELKTNLDMKSESEEKECVVYRGWMLSKVDKYNLLYDKLYVIGYQLINTPAEYQRCHHFGEIAYVYHHCTPSLIYKHNLSKELFERLYDETGIKDLSEEIKSTFNSDFFILKDSVKSEKGSSDLFKLSVNLSPEDLREKILLFIDKRGSNYNNGLLFKEFVQLKTFQSDDKKMTNEYRLFILNNRAISVAQNSELNVNKIIHNIPDYNEILRWSKNVMSNFFTVDIAELEDGSWTVIETGDGQVSGLSPNQNFLEFYKKLFEEVLILQY